MNRLGVLIVGALISLPVFAAGGEAALPEWLAWLSNPDLAYILFLFALLGLIVEVSSPGVILPGLAGAVGIVLSLYALQALGANMWAALVIFAGLALFIVPAFSPTLDKLAWAGIPLLGLGSFWLLDAQGLNASLASYGWFDVGIGGFLLLDYVEITGASA